MSVTSQDGLASILVSYAARIEDGSAADWEWGALEDLAGFLEWKHQQEDLKREVHYLVSLDT